ncbi:MAG TPA: DUF6677 family protein [Pseudacidobacterium sp.]|jgi:hypothetical protein|nr:DUF6677 family protein [Pseudacidobacterium sp.]
MASKVQVSSKAEAKAPGFPYIALILGWLVPGLGHLLTKHRVRALLLFVSITSMFILGLLMQGKLYQANTGDMLEMLGFAGNLGNGALYILGRFMDLGHGAVQIATADYGTKFIVVAGLLNVISAVDAHNLYIGRKPSC